MNKCQNCGQPEIEAWHGKQGLELPLWAVCPATGERHESSPEGGTTASAAAEDRDDVQHLVSGDTVWVQFGPKQRKAKIVEKLGSGRYRVVIEFDDGGECDPIYNTYPPEEITLASPEPQTVSAQRSGQPASDATDSSTPTERAILLNLIQELREPGASFEFPSAIGADYGVSLAYVKDCLDRADARLREADTLG